MQDQLVAGLTPALRQMYRVFEQHGPMTAEALRDPLPLEGEADWKGRREGGGRTTAIRALQAKGLIRLVGTKGRRKTRVYEATPTDQRADEAAKYARHHQPKRKRDMTGDSARIHEYRQMEKAAGGTSRGHWIAARRRILELGKVVRNVSPMLYWSAKSVPEPELEDVYDEMVLVAAYFANALAVADATRSTKRQRDKIKALYAKAESTEFAPEAESFRAKARQLEDDLDAAA